MATIGQITSAYNNGVAEVCLFLNKQGYEIGYPTFKFENKNQQVIVSCVEPMYFRRWPYRATAANNQRIDIVAEILETVRLSDGRCTRAALRLNYFGCDGDKRAACDAIHYDFNIDVQERHPVCHAQATNSILAALPDAFPTDCDASALVGRHQAIRIPSAFVNIAGLFAKVVADHLPKETVDEFWDVCKVHIDRMPDHASTATSDAVIDAKTLRSYWWYKW